MRSGVISTHHYTSTNRYYRSVWMANLGSEPRQEGDGRAAGRSGMVDHEGPPFGVLYEPRLGRFIDTSYHQLAPLNGSSGRSDPPNMVDHNGPCL